MEYQVYILTFQALYQTPTSKINEKLKIVKKKNNLKIIPEVEDFGNIRLEIIYKFLVMIHLFAELELVMVTCCIRLLKIKMKIII